MAVRLIVAPPATGKTTLCVDRVRGVLDHKPLATVWVVLPDRLQRTYFRRRLADAGGVMGARVGLFDDVYRHVLEAAGSPVPVASGPIMRQVVGAAIDDVASEGRLPHYKPIARTPGFRKVMSDRIAELKRARIDPAVFVEEVTGDDALTELGLVYGAYQARLLELDWADKEGLGWLAVMALEHGPSLAEHWSLLVVDGFDNFIEAQRGFLAALSRTGTEIVVTLPGQPGSVRRAHRRFAGAVHDLCSDLDTTPETLSRAPTLPSSPAHIERQLFEITPARATPSPDVELRELRSPADESREALRWIKALHVRDGIPLDRCAIITPDPEGYRPFLREAAVEMGVPLLFTQGEALASAPAIAALLDLLKLPELGFPRRLTVEAIRTPYFDLSQIGLRREDADVLESVSRAGQVVEGLDQWIDALEKLAARAPSSGQRDDDVDSRSLPTGEDATRFAQALTRLGGTLMPEGVLPTRRTMTQWVAWLEDLLDLLSFPNTGSATDAGAADVADDGFVADTSGRDGAAFLGLRESLRAIAMSDELRITHLVGYTAFVAELTGALDSASISERPDRNLAAVQVTTVLESRGPRFAAVAMLGLSEGVFPQVEREDPYIQDAMRTRLGLERRLEREQRGLFYLVVTRADRRLLLTRPYLAEDGQDKQPSPYWRAVCSLFDPPHTSDPADDGQPSAGLDAARGETPCAGLVRRVHGDEPRPVVDAASYEELLVWSVRRAQLPRAAHDVLEPRWHALRHARDVLAVRSAPRPRGSHEGGLAELTASFADTYGPGFLWSPTRLETYGSCPMRFLVERVLKLEPDAPPELGMDALQLGTMLHNILEVAYQKASDPTDPDAVIAALGPVADAEFGSAPEKYGFRETDLWAVDQVEYRSWLEETVQELAAMEGSWRPHAMEAKFGIDKDGTPAVTVDTPSGPIKVRGLVDRIDKDDRGRVRVLDYKTGSSHLAKSDLVNGTRLQLPIYALAARDALEMGVPTEGLYWAIRAARAGTLRLSRFKHETDEVTYSGPEGAIQLMAEHVGNYVSGVRQARFAPIPNKGECPAYCAAASWCWRYRPRPW